MILLIKSSLKAVEDFIEWLYLPFYLETRIVSKNVKDGAYASRHNSKWENRLQRSKISISVNYDYIVRCSENFLNLINYKINKMISGSYYYLEVVFLYFYNGHINESLGYNCRWNLQQCCWLHYQFLLLEYIWVL